MNKYNRLRCFWVVPLVLLIYTCGSQDPETNGQVAHEVVLFPQGIRWKQLPIQYRIASSVPQSFRSEIQSGFEAWNQIVSKMVFKYKGTKHLDQDDLSPDHTVNQNVVFTTEQLGTLTSETDVSSGRIPLGRTFLYGLTYIRKADIYLFDFTNNYVTGRPETGDTYSIKSVVMHEAGHMLFGPEHSQDPSSIMTSVLYPKGHRLEKLFLGSSDIAKFQTTYGDM